MALYSLFLYKTDSLGFYHCETDYLQKDDARFWRRYRYNDHYQHLYPV